LFERRKNFNWSSKLFCIGRNGRCRYPKVYDPEEERRREQLRAKRARQL
jgi:hypothetical protein